jgi:hypothetical protein
MEDQRRTRTKDREGKYVPAEYEKAKQLTLPLGNDHLYI